MPKINELSPVESAALRLAAGVAGDHSTSPAADTLLRDVALTPFSVAIRRPKGIMSMIGDSNTDDAAGRPGWQGTCNIEWFGSGGMLEGWTNYNIGSNGSELAGWVASIGTGDSSTPVTTRLSAWAAVNANPDVIVVALGTNDLNMASKRASGIGTEANLRANLLTLVNFFLNNSTAAIWLRMPQPFAHEDFMGITGWADAADAREASRRLRVVYREWENKSPRVEVFDSHDLFGDYVDNKATEGLDPDTGLPMLADSLHPNELGFRRMVEAMTRQVRKGDPKSANIKTARESIFHNAAWAANLYVRSVEVGGTLLTMSENPQDFLRGELTLPRTIPVNGLATQAQHGERKARKSELGRVEDHYLLGKLTVFKELLGLYGKGPVKLYFPATGNTYTCTTFRLSDTVVYDGRTFHRFSIGGTSIVETEGVCTVYVETMAQHPFAHQFFDITIPVSGSEADVFAPIRSFVGQGIQVVGGSCMREVTPGTAGSVSLNLVTANNGVFTGTEFGTIAMSAGIGMGVMTVNATNFPSGVLLDMRDSNTLYGVRAAVTNFQQGAIVLHCKYY